MIKKEIRKIFRNRREGLTSPDKEKLDDLLLIRFQSLELPFIRTVISFFPIEGNNEPDTRLFTRYLFFRNPGLRVAYTKTDLANLSLTAYLTDEQTKFRLSSFNIYEPESGEIIRPSQADLVLVPLLAFDKDGYRVGYGKGLYDRFLANCGPKTLKVGFSYFDPIDRIGDRDEFDVPLSLCITPQDIYVF